MNLRSTRYFSVGLAFAAMACIDVVEAAPVPAPVSGDLFLGFRASDGQGSSVSLLVKLGPDTTFRNAAAGSSFDVTGLGNLQLDLQANFGANWHTRDDFYWGIFGTRSSANSTVYGSKARAVASEAAPSWPALNSTERNGVASAITSVLEEVGGYKGGEATANSPVATLQTNTLQASSYNKQVATPGSTDFSSLSQWTSIEGNFGGGAPAAVLDLFRLASTGASHVGSFSISSGGVVHFTAPPLPSVDTDGDGFTDADESFAGTSPTNGADFPQAQLSAVPTGLRIQSAATANRTYTIEYIEKAGSGAWTPIGTHSSGPAASPVDFIDTDPVRRSKTTGFYRVKISS